MLASALALLRDARDGGYALGAFNVYNLEGVRAVLAAAEAERSPAILQLHPRAIAHGGHGLVVLCGSAAEQAAVPVAVHLDHASTLAEIHTALSAGLTSVMADASHLSYAENVAFTRAATELVHRHEAAVEAELGRLTGDEDSLSVPEYESRLTDPGQAADFVRETGIDSLAVCIGNAHGRTETPPSLDFERLVDLREAVTVPLVLHGASGLAEEQVRRSIELGVCKFNVNTELREAYLAMLKEGVAGEHAPDLVALLEGATAAMQGVVMGKLRLFGSSRRA